MICCAEERNTPFCPMCGKQMMTGVAGLLYHVQTTVSIQEKALATSAETLSRLNADKENGNAYAKTTAIGIARAMPRREKLLSKWKMWERELSQLMGRDADR